MKIKKLENLLFFVAIACMLLAFVMFNVSPLLDGEGFEYVGLEAFLAGAKALITFDFKSAPYVLIFALGSIAILCLLVWLISLIAKKAKFGKIFEVFISIISVAVLFSLASAVFVAKVNFNGKEIVLYEGMGQVKDHILGKCLTIGSIALAYSSLLCNTLFAFVTSITAGDMIVKKEVIYKEAAPVAVEQGPSAEQVAEFEKFLARREQEFLDECVKSGQFDVYEEYEFEKPFEGLTKEPVVEEIVVEEETKIHANFDPRRNRKVTVKR